MEHHELLGAMGIALWCAAYGLLPTRPRIAVMISSASHQYITVCRFIVEATILNQEVQPS